MKRTFLLAAAAMAVFAAGCNKEEDAGILPNITFKTGAGYAFSDTTVAPGTMLLTGINANKTEDKDVLKRFVVTANYDGGADSTLVNLDLSGTDGDNYSTDYTIHTRNAPGTEKYTYTITNRDGLVNSIKLLVTVQ